MSVASVSELHDVLAGVVGEPLALEVLKDKPGRRRTLRASGPRATVIAKSYASQRAPVVAQRVDALSLGPAEPVLPQLVLVDPVHRVVVVSEVPGRPFSEALVARDLQTCTWVGAAFGRWHGAWRERTPAGFRSHSVEDELAILTERARQGPAAAARAVTDLPAWARQPWPCSTVVHRDLYEEQVIVGDRVGLIDLDDAAAGPPELDLGNLWAHLRLFAGRRGIEGDAAWNAILTGYQTAGPPLDATRLEQCLYLSELRLATIHPDFRPEQDDKAGCHRHTVTRLPLGHQTQHPLRVTPR